jgi:membrane fusion protein (multidrug efflux system)
MFARVRLVIEEHKAVPVIMKESLIGQEPELYVYAIENQKAVLKKVTAGIRRGSEIEIKEGLKAGDLIVILGQQRLYENAPVNVENANAAQPQ